LRAIDGGAEPIRGIDFATFQANFQMLRTLERCIEIVSEATRHVPDDIKARYPRIPWRQIAGIGNVRRHNHDIVDVRIIWEVATIHFPALRVVIVEIIPQLTNDT
jgi:uncharacterized protein with HEPN domain